MTQSNSFESHGAHEVERFTGSSRLLKPALMNWAENKKARFVLQFGGQASDYFPELRELYKNPLLRKKIELACQIFESELKHPDMISSGLVPADIDLLTWLQNEKAAPSREILSSSLVSQALIFVTQMMHYLDMIYSGYVPEFLLAHSQAAVGHSQGVMAAVLVASGCNTEEFETHFVQFVRYFVWQGLRMQQAFLPYRLPGEILRECAENHWGEPKPMMAIQGLEFETLQKFISQVNTTLPPKKHLFVALINGDKRLVVSGSLEAQVLLRRSLADWEKQQNKKPQTRIQLTMEFLPVSAPYHSSHMQTALEKFFEDLKRLHFSLQATDLKIAVYDTATGKDLRTSQNILRDLVDSQFIHAVDWQAVTKNISRKKDVTHVIDFGPGSMAGTLTFLNCEGQGVHVISYATRKGREEVLTSEMRKLSPLPALWTEALPQVVKRLDGSEFLENRFTKFTGCPPIFGGGMTPTTVETDIVVAAVNQGYWVEWAGGGQVTEAILRTRFEDIKHRLEPGRGIIFNALYLDSYLWNLHFPLLLKLKGEGYPIHGLTISAGIPSRDKAREILAFLKQAGIWCNSFKPGSDDQIKNVLEIADDHPDETILMQIEGGKAGGHHSWEDLYGLLERNYAAIRRRKNIILCAGGGIGLESEAWTYLAGNWHQSGRLMPVDAVFLGTRLMACLEAKTSPQIKKLLVEIAGTENWVERGQFVQGVTSGQSQLGADVHYAENHASRTAHFIDTISSLPEEEILKRKDEIVRAIDKTAKPYFGDLQKMTYLEVLERLCELMAPGKMPDHFLSDGLWFDATFKNRFIKFYERTVERCFEGDSLNFVMSPALGQIPKQDLETLKNKIPSCASLLLHPEDVDYFLFLCRLPGKPVNFVPVIDKSIKRWFKSDSLWQAHDPRYSAEEVLTIPGITAVKGIKKVDEPVSQIFSDFIHYALEKTKTLPQKNESILQKDSSLLDSVGTTTVEISQKDEKEKTIRILKNGILPAVWLEVLAAQGQGSLSDFLRAEWILDAGEMRHQDVKNILVPEVGYYAVLGLTKKVLSSLRFFDEQNRLLVEIREETNLGKNFSLTLTIYHASANGKTIPVTLQYRYEPQRLLCPWHRLPEAKHDAFEKLYRDVWLDGEKATEHEIDLGHVFESEESVTAEMATAFRQAIQDPSSSQWGREISISQSMAFMWKPLARCLLHPAYGLDLVNLLHLSNEFECVSNQFPASGDRVSSRLQMVAREVEASGEIITIVGTLYLRTKPFIKIKSRFLVRQAKGWKNLKSDKWSEVQGRFIFSELTQAVLQKKSWIRFLQDVPLHSELSFRWIAREKISPTNKAHLVLNGRISRGDEVVATLELNTEYSAAEKNPVQLFFDKAAFKKSLGEIPHKNGNTVAFEFSAPHRNEAYSLASLDLNPIHTDSRVAAVAGLPTDLNHKSITVVHGMWVSAATLAKLEAELSLQSMSWKTDFVGMVSPDDLLSVEAQQVANHNGYLVYAVTVKNKNGATVLIGRGEFKQNHLAYVFTGQGSQVVGMGMNAYNSFPVARAAWDEADVLCREKLGFSILTVVRDNPKEMYVNGELVSHPQGVLNLTQFAQVALTILAYSQVQELRQSGLFVENCFLAGHSLGEYAALSCTGIIPLEKVIRVVYQRGLTMQNFVLRDAEGKSPYGMIVVRPNIVGLNEDTLQKMVADIAGSRPMPDLFVVNYNIQDMQYAVTGHLQSLHEMMRRLKKLEQELGGTRPSFVLIEGVDVPFHSSILLPGVEAFRKTLLDTIPENINPSLLVGCYIPNLTAEIFSLERDAIERIFIQTQSPLLQEVLANWNERSRDPKKLARTVLIELLAYQFASPVRWIETQNQILAKATFGGRVVEIGPSGVLTGMLKATAARHRFFIKPEALHFELNRISVFYQNQQETTLTTKPTEDLASSSAVPTTTAIVVQKAAPTKAVSQNALPDVPFDIATALKGLVALKLNLKPEEIAVHENLETLCSGNSARRNEVLADIGAEFQIGAMDEAHLLPFEKLVQQLEQKSRYDGMGPVLQKGVDRFFKEKISLSKSDATAHLTTKRGLGRGYTDHALLSFVLLSRVGNSARSSTPLSALAMASRLSDSTAVISWLDTAVDEMGRSRGVVIPVVSGGSESGDAVVSSEALHSLEKKYFGEGSPFLRWAEDFRRLVKKEENESSVHELEANEDLQQLEFYKETFGAEAEKYFKPLWNVNKHVRFQSVWNWQRRDFVKLLWQKINRHEALTAEEISSWSSDAALKKIGETAQYFVQLATEKKNQILAEQLFKISDVGVRHAVPLQVATGGSPLQIKTGQSPIVRPIKIPNRRPHVDISDSGEIQYSEIPRSNEFFSSDDLKELTQKKLMTTPDEFLIDLMSRNLNEGIDFTGKTILVTGASPGSIAWEAVHFFLNGGGRVIATTSSYNEKRLLAFRRLYQRAAQKNAELHVLPLNQGVTQDVEALVNWCFAEKMIPDFVLPFAASSETATLSMMKPEVSGATLRVLLQGIQGLVASLAKNFRKIHTLDKSCVVVLPLSPNHGHFGGDGAYADAKMALESLFHRWHSEFDDWGRFVSLVGTRIGWVRGTSLMSGNNVLAAAMEHSAGVRTFSATEAGFFIASVCHEEVLRRAQKNPVQLAFTGNFENVTDLAKVAGRARQEIEKAAKLKRDCHQWLVEDGQIRVVKKSLPSLAAKAKIVSDFPSLETLNESNIWQRNKKIDAENTIVVVGFGEVSPFGSSRPRFEMECDRSFSPASALEIAWIMGLVHYEDGQGKTPYVGWVDAKSQTPVADIEIATKYRDEILKNTGIRFADGEIQKFDPRRVLILSDVILTEPLRFDVDSEQALRAYQNEHADKMSFEKNGANAWQVTLHSGAVIKVPKRISLSRYVAGQIPKGWSAERFGVPADLVQQVDRAILYNFVATAQAFATSGISPEELRQTLGATRVGNSQGLGMGGMKALDRMYHDLREDRERQGDTLQETLINVNPAWVNQSYVGGYGPTVNPVSACATAVVSLATGMDLILTGKADFIVAGGFDDYGEEGVLGFQDMAATCETQTMLDKGIPPHAMSRPNDARRGGFVEAQGGGTLLLTRLSCALNLGLPIYGILSFANNHADGVHTSIPAPGLGLLAMGHGGKELAPLTKSLAPFGLTIDDITVVSKHDTSTAANDPNENRLHDTLQKYLGRHPGNPLIVHSQKAVLGHAKGGAGAWQTIAALQMLSTGLVPGNPNLEDVDSAMKKYDSLLFSDETLDLGSENIHAVLLTSLGFGHVGAAALLVHPNFALAQLDSKTRASYFKKRQEREKIHVQKRNAGIMGKIPFFTKAKERLSGKDEMQLLLKQESLS